MPEIRLTELCKSFPSGVVGLHPTTLHIPDGSHFVLLGPSGSGKSTLLRLIAGLESPDGGAIHFGERPVHELPPHARHVALLAQRTALYPGRDVRGNIRIGLELEQSRKQRKARIAPAESAKRVDAAAQLLGISGLLDRRPHELSGGEGRRVVLARALARRADVYLLDEPLGQLDSALADKLSQDLHLLQRHLRLTILHVTHDPIEAMALADRVGLLVGGRILQSGTPDEVYSQPSNRTVGLHFGRPPINLIDGTGDGNKFVSTDGWLRVTCPFTGALTLGVRPADVGFGPCDGFALTATGTAGAFRRVDDRLLVLIRGAMTELLGFSDQPITDVRLDVWLRMDRLHWFDRATGDRAG